jgi:hypothetical protein
LSEDEVEEVQLDVIKDKKQAWRMEQISSEGNDPAASNQKMGEEGPSDLGGGGGDLGGGGGEEAGGGGGEEGGLPPLEEETRKDRERGNRDQTGNKEKYTSSHTKIFGEDPLGNKENKEKSRTDRSTRHIYRGGALSMDEDLKNIKTALKTRYNNKHKQVITEKSLYWMSQT